MKSWVKQVPGLLKSGWARLRRQGARLAAAIALAAVVYLIDLQLEKKSPDSTTIRDLLVLTRLKREQSSEPA